MINKIKHETRREIYLENFKFKDFEEISPIYEEQLTIYYNCKQCNKETIDYVIVEEKINKLEVDENGMSLVSADIIQKVREKLIELAMTSILRLICHECKTLNKKEKN